jgi:hypothetical protein
MPSLSFAHPFRMLLWIELHFTILVHTPRVAVFLQVGQDFSLRVDMKRLLANTSKAAIVKPLALPLAAVVIPCTGVFFLDLAILISTSANEKAFRCASLVLLIRWSYLPSFNFHRDTLARYSTILQRDSNRCRSLLPQGSNASHQWARHITLMEC